MDMKDGKEVYRERGQIFALDNFSQFVSRKICVPNVAREKSILFQLFVGEILFDKIWKVIFFF